ncbi:MAG: ribonuclease domain-containing protein [Variovorax sp.]
MAAYASITSFSSRLVMAGLVLAGLGIGTAGPSMAQFRDAERPSHDATTTPSIPLAELPAQGQRTYQAIFQGGPFRHDKDGAVFGNRERLLPSQRRGHYREYTVDTPGASNRGARRIVCGGEPRTAPSMCWYTADHYASFRRIVP